MADAFPVGTRVLFRGKADEPAYAGTVRFIGEASFKPGVWVGVELDQDGIGKNNGTVRGEKYFECSKPGNYGVFARTSMLQRLDDSPPGAAPSPAVPPAVPSRPPVSARPPATLAPAPSAPVTPTADQARPMPPPRPASAVPPTAAQDGGDDADEGEAAQGGAVRTIPGTHAAVGKYVAKVLDAKTEISFALFSKKAQISSFPPKLLEYPQVVNVDFSGNQIADFPHEAGVFASLQRLSFAKNKFVVLPASIGVLPVLKTLIVSDNLLTAIEPGALGRLASLRVLDLSGNKLFSLPPDAANLPSLTDLRLRGNKFSDVPVPVLALAGLSRLELSENEVASVTDDIGRLISLKELLLADNRLSALPSGLGNCRALTRLTVSGNKLSTSSALPASVQSLVSGGLVIDFGAGGGAAPATPGHAHPPLAPRAAAAVSQDMLTIPSGSRLDGESPSTSAPLSPDDSEDLRHVPAVFPAGPWVPTPRPAGLGPDGILTVAQMADLVTKYIEETQRMNRDLQPALERIRAAKAAKSVEELQRTTTFGAANVDRLGDLGADDAEDKDDGGAGRKDDDADEEGDNDEAAKESDDERPEATAAGAAAGGEGGAKLGRAHVAKREKYGHKRARERANVEHIAYRMSARASIRTARLGGLYRPVPRPDLSGLLTQRDPQELAETDAEELKELEAEELSLHGSGFQGDRLKVKSSCARRLQRYYTFQWWRRDDITRPWRRIPYTLHYHYTPTILDVFCSVKVVLTPVDPRKPPLEFVKDNIQPGDPAYRDLTIEGPEYHNTEFTLNGQYYGGFEGASRVLWSKSYDSVNWLPLTQGPTYQATSDDSGATIRVEYTPVRVDGAVGKTVMDQTGPLVVAPKVLKQIRAFIVEDKASFDVTTTAADKHGAVSVHNCTLKINGAKINLKTVKKGLDLYKDKMSDDLRIFLAPERKTMLKIQFSDKETDAYVLDCETSSNRDLIALSISYFTKALKNKGKKK